MATGEPRVIFGRVATIGNDRPGDRNRFECGQRTGIRDRYGGPVRQALHTRLLVAIIDG
jgi:hypothetical protein